MVLIFFFHYWQVAQLNYLNLIPEPIPRELNAIIFYLEILYQITIKLRNFKGCEITATLKKK